jgi:hypothetical protein
MGVLQPKVQANLAVAPTSLNQVRAQNHKIAARYWRR